MIVLDTNVVSELMRKEADPVVLDWLDRQAADEICITAVTAAEILHGIARLAERKQALSHAAAQLLDEELADRVLCFDRAAAGHYAELICRRQAAGNPISMADAQIAAICLSHDAPLATRNTRDFDGTGVGLVNPWPVRPLKE